MEKVFTFWEGQMPEYIKMCLESWKFDFTILNYENLHHFTEFDIESAKRFTMPQIADCVRVHALRDNGGYWLDADTVMIGDKLPEENMVGDPIKRTNTIGFLHTKAHSMMFEKWAEYQDNVIASHDTPTNWDVVGNAFTDPWVQMHREVSIYPVNDFWPETYMVSVGGNRRMMYQQFYFDKRYTLSDIHDTDMLMLHNSWTPGWYKELTREEVLLCDCTLSNILCEVI